MPIADMPQSNKQHAVPQNFMDVEFKLIGDLTMRQFTYLLIFGILTYISMTTVIGIFKLPFAFFFAAMGLGLAFVPVAERGLDDWVVSFIKAINTPTQRVWQKEPEIPSAFTYQSLNVVKQEMITLAPTSSRRKLEEYLNYQSGAVPVDPLDIPEREYAMKVHEAFAQSPTGSAAYGIDAPSHVGVSVIEEPEEYEQEPARKSVEKAEEEKSADDKQGEQQPGRESVEQQEISQYPGTEDKKPKEVSHESKQGESVAQSQIVTRKPTQPAHNKKESKFLLQTRDLRTKPSSSTFLSPMTPDMHSGRKFSNLLPSSGELVLPIRGERVLRTSDQVQVEDDIEEKTEKLQKLLSHIREKEGVGTQQKEPAYKNKPQSLNQNTVNIVRDVEKKPEPQKQIEQVIVREEPEEYRETRSSSYSGEVIPALTHQPDVISGIVKNSSGELVQNALLIVKNAKKEAVRAFKTNTMGQFVLLSPMDKGNYTVEISPSNNFNETFDIISVEVKGEIIPPLLLKGK